MLLEGGKVCYYSGDIQQLANEIKIIQPSIMLGMFEQKPGTFFQKVFFFPLGFNKLHQHILHKMSLWLKTKHVV